MHSYPLPFLITAVIAAIGGLSAAAGGIAKILFALSLSLFVISFFLGRRIPPV